MATGSNNPQLTGLSGGPQNLPGNPVFVGATIPGTTPFSRSASGIATAPNGFTPATLIATASVLLPNPSTSRIWYAPKFNVQSIGACNWVINSQSVQFYLNNVLQEELFNVGYLEPLQGQIGNWDWFPLPGQAYYGLYYGGLDGKTSTGIFAQNWTLPAPLVYLNTAGDDESQTSSGAGRIARLWPIDFPVDRIDIVQNLTLLAGDGNPASNLVFLNACTLQD